MFARELSDINAYINGVGEINLPSLTGGPRTRPVPLNPLPSCTSPPTETR